MSEEEYICPNCNSVMKWYGTIHKHGLKIMLLLCEHGHYKEVEMVKKVEVIE